jgi:hypothetical protein
VVVVLEASKQVAAKKLRRRNYLRLFVSHQISARDGAPARPKSEIIFLNRPFGRGYPAAGSNLKFQIFWQEVKAKARPGSQIFCLMPIGLCLF